MRMFSIFALVAVLFTGAFAQRPRSTDPEPAKTPARTPAPRTVKAKYEGGVFGYRKTMEGTLTLDDNQVLFKDKTPPKEINIPYNAITSAFADTQKRRPKAATIAGQVPLIYAPNPLGFIKTKVRYLTIQYSDPDSNVSGVTSFKLENKELLESVLQALAEKTGMILRGDVYVKKRPEDAVKTKPNQ